jgi:hypothetical protein
VDVAKQEQQKSPKIILYVYLPKKSNTSPLAPMLDGSEASGIVLTATIMRSVPSRADQIVIRAAHITKLEAATT